MRVASSLFIGLLCAVVLSHYMSPADTEHCQHHPSVTAFGGHRRWQSWSGVYKTCTPWLMPRTDADLRTLLHIAETNHYIVRPSGATSSAGPLVTNGSSVQELAVSLAQYTAPVEWEFALDESATPARVRVNAGWSL